MNRNILDLMADRNTKLCCGLDPDFSKIPYELKLQCNFNEILTIERFLYKVIDLTIETVCAYKIQKAFFDNYSLGSELIKKIVNYIHSINTRMTVIIDCKIGDIENTMNSYRKLIFGSYHADGVVLNPYMGDDVFTPFIEDVNKSFVVLIKTSNPQSIVTQDVEIFDGRYYWEYMLELLITRWNTNNNMIPVLSSSVKDSNYSFIKIRKNIPKDMPILFAGGGAQGGDLSKVKELLNSDKIGVFVNFSRGILYPSVCSGDWQNDIAINLKKINISLTK